MTRNPLAPRTYLIRNAARTLPLIGVIVLAILLITGIVALMNSIPYSIRTIYKYSAKYTGIASRSNTEVTDKMFAIVKKEAPVPLGRIIRARGSQAQVRSIVGGWPFVVLAMEQADIPYYLKRMGDPPITGRTPKAGMPEILISEPVARNLKVKIGDTVLGPENPDSYSPMEVKVVGIAQTDYWLMLAPIEYHRQFHFPPSDALLVFAQNDSDQDRLDRWIDERMKGEQVRVFAYFLLEEETNEMFQILYKILNVVIFTLVIVITLMMGMLINIYLSQRIQEFGLLQALGYTKNALIRRVLGESVLVVFVGWVCGLAAAYGMLNYVKARLMDPNAFALDIWDQSAYIYTIPVPVMIFIVAVSTMILRFKKFDPVGVVERRLV
ncbi:MAG: ABC transporter permease [Fimbriimonadaceae bacterium]|nr:ABC transporter permease [Fimbriimonadaceae bacterium]